MIGMRGLTALITLVLLTVFMSLPAQAQLFGRKNDDSSVRVNELEERLRLLTGQIEQLSFQLRELQDQMRRMQEDNEYRFQQLEGTAPGRRSEAVPPTGGNTQELEGSVQSLGTLALPGGSGDGEWSETGGYEAGSDALPGAGPIDLSALAKGIDPLRPADSGTGGFDVPQDAGTTRAGEVVAGLTGSGDPRTDYDRAYGYAVNGQYGAAEQEFRAFIRAHPDHRLAANAQYWLGESLLAQGDYRQAADAFLKTYTDHPAGDKSADSLLKLGVALNGLGEADAACATFAELLTKFPSAAPAVLSQAREERSRARCS